MFTQPRDPNNKHIPAFESTAPIITEQSILFRHVSKNTKIMMIREKPMRDQNLHKNLLYNTSVPILMTEQKGMMTDQTNFTTDNVAEVHHEINMVTKPAYHKKDVAL